MTTDAALSDAGDARSRWRAIDTELNRLRSVYAALIDLQEAVSRGHATDEPVRAVQSALDAFDDEDSTRRTTLRFLTEPVFPKQRTFTDEFHANREIESAADAVATNLVAFVNDSVNWRSVEKEVGEIVDQEVIDERALEDLTTLFGIAVEAGVAQRERESDRIVDALRDAYETIDEPLPPLDEQPIALLPVRLETRFVDEDGGRDFLDDDSNPEQLLIRIYPDQIHVDSHESELTNDEVEWGTYFWTVLWFARHPDPVGVFKDSGDGYLEERISDQRLRGTVKDLVGDVVAGEFSEEHHDWYQELKERAWKKLVDRFGRERAAFVVHSLKPTDEELAIDLLSAPPEPLDPTHGDSDPVIEQVVYKHEGELVAREFERPDATERPVEDELDVVDEPIEEELDIVEEIEDDETRLGTDVSRSRVGSRGQSEAARDLSRIRRGHRVEVPAVGRDAPADSDDDEEEEIPELPERLPALAFPEVPRRPESWTKSARAKLLPDRWIAIAEWEDAAGNSQRTAVTGNPIRDPLQVGPGLESVAEDLLTETRESDSHVPDGTEWLVDFRKAEDVGMAVRIPLRSLAAFDHRRGFDRISVIGVKSSMLAEETPDALADLLDSHHYTDGLSFVEQGTPTNNHDLPSGYSRREDPRDSMEVECVPPKVESGDRSDGDLLARALAIDHGDGMDHVFANVANADGTEQRDARHMNSALWPTTLGYYYQHILVENHFANNLSIWKNGENGTTPSVDTHLLWLDTYRRHFIRYVRGRGPFPAMRIGSHPYGILPATAVETDRDLSVFGSSILPDLLDSRVTLDDLRNQGYDLPRLATGGIDPQLLVEAGAPADAVIEAGAEPSYLLRDSMEEDITISQERITPPPLTRDGIGLTATSALSEERLEGVGIDVDRLSSVDISVQDLARGTVTDGQLEHAGVTVEQLAEVLLRDEAKKLGITPDAVARAGVTRSELLRGEFSDKHVTTLGLDTRAVSEVILPRKLKQAGITPKRLEDAGISPLALLNGEVDEAALHDAGIDYITVVEALLPEELVKAGITPKRLSKAGVTLDELFNGTITDEKLRSVGITTDMIANALLPSELQEAGATAAELEDAGITPAAVLDGTVTPADLEAAGADPQTLAEAGVLADVLTALGDGLGELISAGLDPGTLLSNGVTAETLMEAGIDSDQLLEAGLTPEQLEVADIEPARDAEANEAEQKPADDIETNESDTTTHTLLEDVPYAVTVMEDLNQAERDAYRFSFDPATPHGGPGPGSNLDATGVPDRTRSKLTEVGIHDENLDEFTEKGMFPIIRPIMIDNLMRERLRERVTGFGAHWGGAAANLPFGSVMDENGLIQALKRTGVSSDIRHRTMVYSGEERADFDPIASEVSDLFLPGHQRTVRDALNIAEATDLDPRAGYLYPFDSDSTAGIDIDIKFPQFPEFHQMVGSPYRGIALPHDDVDADIDAFIDIIRARRWRSIDQLSHPLDLWQGMRIDPPYAPSYPRVLIDFDSIEESEQEWEQLSMTAQRRRFVEEIETNDDPIELVDRLVKESWGTDKPTVMAENQADFGDSGVLRSLLRILLQFGTLQTYITARRRIGAAFSDPSDGWPEPYLWTDQRGPLDGLDDEIPDALVHHPAIDNPEMTYGDALHVAAADRASTTSIDSRVSEYTDSLAYLRDRDPASLATAMHETLDLASHRLDAWWTSIATKDLFELRELQGTNNGSFDRNVWSGAASDLPLATVDPALSRSLLGESITAERIGIGEVRASDEGDYVGEDEDNTNEEETGQQRRSQRVRRDRLQRARQEALEPTRRESIDSSDIEDVEFPDVVTRDEPDPEALPDRASTDPGLYVGGYGFIEDLQPDLNGETSPEYVHAPSEQHATTAALLRSGFDAHHADEGGNILELELSPEQVRTGLWLIRGVRRGQSVGELLGFRFERRLHEETLADASELERDEVNLMQYLSVFRTEFPAILDKIKRPDDPRGDGEHDEDLAARDTVDGYVLVKRWDEYPFSRDGDLPAEDGDDATEYEVLETIIEELRTAIRAAGNLLTAESVHQLGRGNFEQVGGSIDALAKGEAFPDPEVATTPRTDTGFPHRHCILIDAIETPPARTPRTRAAPSVATWVDQLLPDQDDIECQATYHWEDKDGETESVSTTVQLFDLELGPLDTMYLFGSDAEESRAELESRLVYHLLRDPPDSEVPADATVEVSLGETERNDATSVVSVLEFARRLRTLIQESRPMRADDLTHPTEERGSGYDEKTLTEMNDRVETAWNGLYTWAEVIDERLSVLDANHAIGDAITDLPHPGDREPDPGVAGSDNQTWNVLAGDTLLPGSRSATTRGDATDESKTVIEQVDALAEAAETVHNDGTVSLIGELAKSIEPDELQEELETLLSSLPAGPIRRNAIRATVIVQASTDATITGTIDQELTIPHISDTGEEKDTDQEDDVSDDGGPTEGTVTVYVWGTDGISWFERETSAPIRSDGTFSTSVNLSTIAPGTPFTVAAVHAGDIAFAADGRVVHEDPDDGPDPGEVLMTYCPNLQRLLWIVDAYDELRDDRGPVESLATAIETADWDRITGERNGMDPDGAVLTDADIEAIDALLDLEDVDPEIVTSAALRLTDPVSRTGLHRLFVVTGDDPFADGIIQYTERQTLTDVRARLHRLLEELTMYNEGIPSRLLSYDPRTALHFADQSDGVVIAAYLDAFLAGSDWVVRYVTDEDVDSLSLVTRLTAWLHAPDALDEPKEFANQLRALSASIESYPALAALFEDLPNKGETSTIAAFANHLETVAELVDDEPRDVPSADDAAAVFASDRSTAADELTTATEKTSLAINRVVGGEPAGEAFREGVLESLREPMATLANYGVLGATPRVPTGRTVADERQLLEQARAVLGRVRGRLAEMETPDEEGALETRVKEQVDQLEILFGDGFVVLPPFTPTNPEELLATFASEDLVPGDRDLAAETWLQRAATVRERIDDFREARTYGEVLTGDHLSPLTISQVPYESGDTWVGVDGVDPLPGRLSLVVQFGGALDPESIDGRMTGLFVDEWHESVPEETETTGVALHYDDPGNRAPNAVLLVPPPSDRSLSLNDLAAVIAETSEWARRRAVDYGDMHGTDHLLPGLYLPAVGARGRQPLVDLRMLEWYDWKAVTDLLEPSFFREQILAPTDTDMPLRGDDE